MNLIKAESITVSFGGDSVISSIDLTLQKGEWLGVLGPNGSGKSTLLRSLGRLITPKAGDLYLEGVSFKDILAATFAKKVAILPQQQTVNLPITVEDFVGLGRSPHQKWWQFSLDSQDKQLVHEALRKTKMINYKSRLISSLSGGERQRVFIAMALAQNTDILLLDEPTTYLDVNYQLEILELLKALNTEANISIITVLHNLDLASRYCDRIALMKAGHLITIGQTYKVVKSSFLEDVFAVEFSRIQTPLGFYLNPIRTIDKKV
ncbi:MAG: ABC transporter ATP-binding protein [Prochlorococcus sp.]